METKRKPLAQRWAEHSEQDAAMLRFNSEDPEYEWLAARLEAFARYLREAWGRADAARMADEAEAIGEGRRMILSQSWDRYR